MGIHVIQSQRIEVLVDAMLTAVQQPKNQPFAVLKAQHFIVPSPAMATWLTQRLAEQKGISANNQFHYRIRGFQWWAYQAVLEQHRDEVRKANLPRLMMKWQIYQYLSQYIAAEQFSLAEQHPLYPIVQRIYSSADRLEGIEQQQKKQNMLYWVAEQTSRFFSNYMEYRSYCQNNCVAGQCHCKSNWLQAWGQNQALEIEQLLAQQDAEQQVFALTKATELEAWQRFVWQQVFAEDYAQVGNIDALFWQQLEQESTRPAALKHLPQKLVLFTLLDLPPMQLQFLRRLGQYLEIFVLHYNPSQEYWADMVDPLWKKRYDLELRDRFIKRQQARGIQVDDEAIQRYVEKFALQFQAEKRESHHPLLTRFGKQARDHFSLLSGLASNEEGQWFDVFPDYYPATLLGKVQSDILHLAEPEQHQYPLQPQDQSIQIHVCHSSLRQLEVLKEQFIHWLSQGTAEQPRRPSDILVLTPKLKDLEPAIRSVFAALPTERDALNPEAKPRRDVHLPIQIAGIASLDASNAWRAILGRIELSQGRFSFDEFSDWLSLAAIQQRYNLDANRIERMLDLLQQAGFKRGLDAAHLQQSLMLGDEDFRYCFKFALDRLALGIAIPEAELFANTLSFDQVQRRDFELIASLIEIYQDIAKRRDWLSQHQTQSPRRVEQWLNILMDEIREFEQAGVEVLASVYQIVKKQERMLTLSSFYEQQNTQQLRQLSLPLSYILEEISNNLAVQLEQAEPTGQITFSQIGQIRPIPYKLVVMLNLDSGKFPDRDQHIAFDLMDMLRPQLGDRSRLEDDQGAFLDALLLAEQSVWLFYNGFDLNDSEVRDPSTVLQELIQHLDFITLNEHPEQSMSQMLNLSGVLVPKHLQSLFHIHPLQPFDPIGFDQLATRYQNQWFQVAQQLQEAQHPRQAWTQGQYVNATLEQSYQVLDADQWLKDLIFPARLYLKTVGIKNISPQQLADVQEPLLLNPLQQYMVREVLLKAERPAELTRLQDLMPVGKTQAASLQLAELDQQQLQQRLAIFAEKPTVTTRKIYAYSADLHFQVTLPEIEQQPWISVWAASVKGKRRAQIWLEYLLWLAALNLGDQGQDLERIVVCSNKTVRCSGVSSAQARVYLSHWLSAWQYAQQQPLVLPADLLLHEDAKLDWQENEQGELQIKDLDRLVKLWQQSDSFMPYGYDDSEWNVKHRDWQYILRDQDTKQFLLDACAQFASVLYQPILCHQTLQD